MRALLLGLIIGTLAGVVALMLFDLHLDQDGPFIAYFAGVGVIAAAASR